MKKLVIGLGVIVIFGLCVVANYFLPRVVEDKVIGGGGVSPVSFGSSNVNTTFSISATTKLLSNNSGRKYAVVSNLSAVTSTFLNLGTASTTVDDYTVIIPAGGKYEINVNNLYTGEVYATSTSAISVGVLEF